MKLLTILLVALTFWACGSGSNQNSKAKVWGGEKVKTGSWQSTVAITANGYIYCSGTIIHPHIVVTAAHCINAVNRMHNTFIYLGNGSPDRKVTKTYSVASGFRSPNYGEANQWRSDVAFLQTEEPLPIELVNIVPFLYKPEEVAQLLQVGSLATIVGFGKREDRGVGEKAKVTTKITKLDNEEIHIGGNGKDSCNYDSGGSAYAQLPNGEWRMFGVVSRGTGGGCGQGGVYGLIHHHLCWIQESSGIDLDLDPEFCESF